MALSPKFQKAGACKDALRELGSAGRGKHGDPATRRATRGADGRKGEKAAGARPPRCCLNRCLVLAPPELYNNMGPSTRSRYQVTVDIHFWLGTPCRPPQQWAQSDWCPESGPLLKLSGHVYPAAAAPPGTFGNADGGTQPSKKAHGSEPSSSIVLHSQEVVGAVPDLVARVLKSLNPNT